MVIPGLPHHVTQRGNRRQRTFFSDRDYKTYLQLMGQACRAFGVEIWAYCLMPNHIHLLVVPQTEIALAKAIGHGHEAYTRYFNFKNKWRGYLWQGRFSSFPVDDAHLLLAARYIELNPVKAKLVDRPEDYTWSSARAHLFLSKDTFINSPALLRHIPEWKRFLEEEITKIHVDLLEKHERSGRPLGTVTFLRHLEKIKGIPLVPKKPGPKPKNESAI